MNDAMRQPHANLDIKSRLAKARKIEELLSRHCQIEGSRVLEIGTGSGVIAAHLASRVGAAGEVVAVDVVDQLQIRKGFRFVKVVDTYLPFEYESFDIVISNHVLEHVGDRNNQLHHLTEIRRVLRGAGWGYVAVPNRWAIIEPHFKLPMLSWIPPMWRSSYMRLTGKGAIYDCNPPSYGSLAALLNAANLSYFDNTVAAARIMKRIENPGILSHLLLGIPAPIFLLLRPIIPTLIFLVRR